MATPYAMVWTRCRTKDGGPTLPDKPQGDGDVTAVETKIATYSGPLPPAVELEAYRRIDATFPERIVAMAESYAAHQQDLERQAMSQERSDRKWGRGVAAAVVLGVLAACLYALHLGYETFATELGTWTIVALAVVFALGKVPDWLGRGDR